jgi:hypothetical protein
MARQVRAGGAWFPRVAAGDLLPPTRVALTLGATPARAPRRAATAWPVFCATFAAGVAPWPAWSPRVVRSVLAVRATGAAIGTGPVLGAGWALRWPAFWHRRALFTLLPGECQLRLQIGFDQAFQCAEIGRCERGGLESMQQRRALAACLRFGAVLCGMAGSVLRGLFAAVLFGLGLAGFALQFTFCGAALFKHGTPPFDFCRRCYAVFFGHLTGGCTVQISTLGAGRQSFQISRAGGVAVQKNRE